jgi:ribonuclease HI
MVDSGGGKPSLLGGLRVGFGFAGAELLPGAPLCLAGAMLDGPHGITGEPDGDLVCQAVLDALLTAAGLPDLRTVFPPGDPALAAPDSYTLLSQTATALLRRTLIGVANLNVTVVTAELDLYSERLRMQTLLADALHLTPGQVSFSFADVARAAIFKPGAVVVYAHLLCEVKQAPAPVAHSKGAGLFTEQAGGAAQPSVPAGLDDEEEQLPERARKFVKADKTKLPPLPVAPTPREGALLIVYTDGACRGNPGPASTGFVVLDDQGRLVHEGGSPLGERTNNQAEYMAVLEASLWVEQHVGREFKVQLRSDSELLVKQLRGEYKIKDDTLKQLALQAMNQLMYFMSFELVHVPRAENSRADALANRVLDGG